MAITVTRWAIRDLHALLPDDYDYPAFDVIAHCSDGKMRHSEAFLDTLDKAAVVLAKYELLGFEKEEGPFEQWTVTTVSESEINWQPAKEST